MGTIVYRKMTLKEAKWKFPELRKVVRMGGGCSPVEVPVTYGEVPGASDADVRERDEGAERATVDRPTPEEWNVDVQWEDVEELWSYDVHPTLEERGASYDPDRRGEGAWSPPNTGPVDHSGLYWGRRYPPSLRQRGVGQGPMP
ncbi:unnamed protein product [Closterium sp. NIES-65]|nr:unnamed protein product [Closterium sp. NIES-65]